MIRLSLPQTRRAVRFALVLTCCLLLRAGVFAQLSPDNSFSVSEGTPVVRTATLDAGADILRVTLDWSTAGSARSDELTVSVVGPDGQTADIPVFDNAQDSTATVNGLEGELILSSQGTAGTYTFTFATSGASTTASLNNVAVDPELILEEFIDAGSLTSGSPTWDRPDENFVSDGAGTHYYETYTFTPAYTGTYVFDSDQVKDGFIFLYSSFSAGSPNANGIEANDDSARGLSFSKMTAALTASNSYTLVTSSFEDIATGQATFGYTNTIRYAVPLGSLPNTWPAFQALHSLTSFTSDKDNDGIADGFEYAFDTDPDTADRIGDYQEIAYNSGTDKMELTFTRDASKTDIEYIVEGNSSLDPLTWSPIVTLTSTTPNNAPGGDANKHRVEDSTTLTAAGGKRFLRLKVNYTGP